MDQGIPPQFIGEPSGRNGMRWTFIYPFSNQTQIVASVRDNLRPLGLNREMPERAIPAGNSLPYIMNWMPESVVSQVCTREEVDEFLNGLQELMEPEIKSIAATKNCMILLVVL